MTSSINRGDHTRTEIVDGFRRFPLAIDGSIFGWTAGVDDTISVLDAFIDHGGRVVSTADHYAGGRSEVMIGRWLSRIDRSSAVVVTKIGRHPDAPGLGAEAIVTATNRSLRRLGTDYIDVLCFDGDHPETPIDESLEAVDALRRAGKVRSVAASGYSGDRLMGITEFASAAAYPTFVAALAEYSLMRRDPFESDLAPALTATGIGAIARLPLASGYLDGRQRSRDAVPSSPMFAGALEHVGRRGSRVLEALDSVAKEVGHPMAVIALAWLLSRRNVSMAMVRVANRGQLTELIVAPGVQLTRQQVGRLDRASA